MLSEVEETSPRKDLEKCFPIIQGRAGDFTPTKALGPGHRALLEVGLLWEAVGQGWHRTDSILGCCTRWGTECLGPDPGVITYVQQYLDSYLMSLNLGFHADKMEKDSTSLLGSL